MDIRQLRQLVKSAESVVGDGYLEDAIQTEHEELLEVTLDAVLHHLIVATRRGEEREVYVLIEESHTIIEIFPDADRAERRFTELACPRRRYGRLVRR